jgi:SAM-dependent methyltransferase
MTRRVIDTVHGQLDAYRARSIDRTIAPDDDMLSSSQPGRVADYFEVGRDAIENIATAMILAEVDEVTSALDMACGYGRVLRHLVAFLPDARVVACDVDPERVDFCTKTFGVEGHTSQEDPDRIQFEHAFDLIWCGSLLTHVGEPRFRSYLELFARSLAEPGVAVVSLHGRFASLHQARRWKYLPDAEFERVEADFRDHGFGYLDYPEGQGPGLDGYGISVSAPSYVMRLVEALPGVRILGYRERAWDDHHDVLVFGKPGVEA